MSVKSKAQGALGGTVLDRLAGERPGPLRAAAGAAIAGGVTSVIVYRLLRRPED
jgi:hypothetical protein